MKANMAARSPRASSRLRKERGSAPRGRLGRLEATRINVRLQA